MEFKRNEKMEDLKEFVSIIIEERRYQSINYSELLNELFELADRKRIVHYDDIIAYDLIDYVNKFNEMFADYIRNPYIVKQLTFYSDFFYIAKAIEMTLEANLYNGLENIAKIAIIKTVIIDMLIDELNEVRYENTTSVYAVAKIIADLLEEEF